MLAQRLQDILSHHGIDVTGDHHSCLISQLVGQVTNLRMQP